MGMFVDLGLATEKTITKVTGTFIAKSIYGITSVVIIFIILAVIWLFFRALLHKNFDRRIIQIKLLQYGIILLFLGLLFGTTTHLSFFETIEANVNKVISSVINQDNTYVLLDKSINKLYETYEIMLLGMPSVTWSSIPVGEITKIFIISLLILATGMIMLIFGALILITNKILFLIILPMAPFFIVLLLFDQTKIFFKKWVILLISLLLTIFLVSTVISITISQFTSYMIEIIKVMSSKTGNIWIPVSKILLIATICIYVIKKTTSISKVLLNGVSSGGSISFDAKGQNFSVASLKTSSVVIPYKRESNTNLIKR